MKSKLFREKDATRDDSFKRDPFKKDLSTLLALSDQGIADLKKITKKRLTIKTLDEQKAVIDEASKALGISPAEFEHIHDLSSFFVSALLPDQDGEDDKVSDIAEDIVSLGLCEKESMQKVANYIAGLKEIVQKELKLKILKVKALKKGGPKLISLSSAISFRAVFEKESKFGQNPETYEAKCAGVVPVVSLNLTLSGGTSDCFDCECEVGVMKKIKDTLELTIKEYEAAKSVMGLEVEDE